MLHQIGAGRLGPVFRAWQPDRDRLAAIKVFQLDLVPEQVNALVGELQNLVALRLAHGAIAAPIGAGIQGPAAYLAQELCTGESLDVAMRQGGGWPPVRALKLVGSIASAIDVAAARGAHHGALHPRDVLVSAGDVRVTGFGVTEALERVGLRVLGRHPYGAPECGAGQRSGTPADVFALAVLAYELLAGKRVSGIAEQGIEELAVAQNADRSALRQVFATALAADPAARYQTARAFAAALDAAMAGASPRLPLDEGLEADARDRTIEIQDEMRPGGGADLDWPAGQASERAAIVNFPGVAPSGRTPAETTADDLDLRILAEPTMEPPALTGPTEFDERVLDEPLTIEPAAMEPLEAEAVADRPEPAPRAVAPPDAPGETAAADSELFSDPPGLPAETDHGRAVARGIAYTATWPLVLALGVGLLVGFALGFGLGMRDVNTGSTPPPQTASASAGAAAPAPHGIAQPPASAALAARKSGITERDLKAPGASLGAAAAAAPSGPVDGRLVIRSTPAGARVLLNGRERGVTPLSLSGLPFATYRLRLELSGYQVDERRVALDRSAATRTLAATLRPVPRPPTGSVVVESRPSGVHVFLDDQALGVTPLTLAAVTAGEHRLRLVQPGFQPWIATVQVTGGERSRVTASLEEGPQE